MGNYNTWGGKNNSWGNKNRKGSSGGSGGPQRDDEKWSKGAKIVAAGVVLLVLANTGLGPIIDTVQNVTDIFDFGKENTEAVETSVKNNTGSNLKQSKGYKSVKGELDLDAGEVKDVLEYLSEQLSEKSVNTSNASAVLVDYSVFKNDKSYVKNIVNKLDRYSNTVSFVALSPNILSETEMDEEFYRISEIISNNNDIAGCGFTKFNTNGLKNNPSVGNFVFAVTFSK